MMKLLKIVLVTLCLTLIYKLISMTDKELFKQKKQAQLDTWKAEVDKLKAKAADSSADAQLELKKQISELEGRIEEGKAKLSSLADAGEEKWESMKEDAEAAWASIRSGFEEARRGSGK